MNEEILEAEESAAAFTEGQANPSRRILVVEDESTIRQVSTTVLIRYGYHADAAEDGAAGWEALQARRYDLLITDNNMPKLSGIDLIKMLRAEDMALPVIMATGVAPTHELDRNPKLNIAAILLKPFTTGELLETVRKTLRVNGGAQEQIEPGSEWRSQLPDNY